ncbi:hypothetical protein RJ639_006490 [Escallonia herrerae]|uniref:GATA-type domain-containing protein n=1 Tax=Escallonia herrerae TaxID=1293975 RepID=A0AA88VYT1_9ASTE|nr:hypothetical protein RJ639_006490 [Escallonia herrerae]
MHRCSNKSQGNMVGSNQNSSFSMLFSMPNHKPYDEPDYMCPFMSSSSSSASVDCTLSLGTPSTRLSNDNSNGNRGVNVHHERRSSYVSNFCWDLLQTSKHAPSPQPAHKGTCGSATNNNHHIAGGDPLLARRCANCDTTSTPLWRNGPRGPKSLCNACGIRFKKEERRATAAATSSGGVAPGVLESQHMINSTDTSWVHHSQPQKLPCLSPSFGNEFRFIEDDDRDSDTGIPFLSWRLNVTDRPSLVHDFTR